MLVKVSEASDHTLDWMVAKAEGYRAYIFTERDMGQRRPFARWCGISVGPSGHAVFNPSTNWNHGGPIIDREKIVVDLSPDGRCCMMFEDENQIAEEYGPTTLIAAMRCYVASKLGDEVEVPDELT